VKTKNEGVGVERRKKRKISFFGY